VSPTTAPTPANGSGDGVSCAGRPIAPPLPTDAIVGGWKWINATLYEDGEDYYAGVSGIITIAPDGTWEGDRQIQMGGAYEPSASGPGMWTFDGRTLTLTYDDGSDADTYTGVRQADFIDPDGAVLKSLQLETADATSCTVYVLVVPPAE
jgi:hypothetical protein